MIKELNRINFNDVLILDTDVDNYNFNEYLKNDRHNIKGFCTRCEQKGCNICPTDASFRLQNISHGATSADVIMSTGIEDLDTSSWHNEGVLFLMEGPSVDSWGFYEENEINGIKKKPTKEWYWIHEKQPKFIYPLQFRGGRYGALFNSIIFTFKLKNAYLTNLVKCGLNNDLNNYKGIREYPTECLSTCVENVLIKEMEALNPKVVFCFGSNVENYLWDLYPTDYPFQVIGLPHPAGQRRGFKDEYYRHLYFTKIVEGLYNSKIIDIVESQLLFKDFLTQYPFKGEIVSQI